MASIKQQSSNADKRQSRPVKRTPSKQYRKIIAAEVASGDCYIFADENWELDLHSPVRLISYKQHDRGYVNPAVLEFRPGSNVDSDSVPYLNRQLSGGETYGVPYLYEQHEPTNVNKEHINGDFSHFHDADKSDDNSYFSHKSRRDSEELRHQLRDAVMATFENGVDTSDDVRSHDVDYCKVAAVTSHGSNEPEYSRGFHNSSDEHHFVDRDRSSLHQDSDSSLGKLQQDVQVKAQRLVNQGVDNTKQSHKSSVSESDFSSLDHYHPDDSADSDVLVKSLNTHHTVATGNPPVIPPRNSLDCEIPPQDQRYTYTDEDMDGHTQVHSRVIADYNTSEATEHEEKRTERIANADSRIHELIKQKKDESHFEEITADGVRVVRNESVEAVKVTRETSITDKQLSALEGFPDFNSFDPNSFETERNIQITKTSEKKVELSPAGDKNVFESTESDVAVHVVTPTPKYNKVDAGNITIHVIKPDNNVNHIEDSDEFPEIYEEEIVKSAKVPKEQSAPTIEIVEFNESAIDVPEGPAPIVDTHETDKPIKSKHTKQKEVVVDKTSKVIGSPQEKKNKVKASNSNSGGFFSKFKRKSDKDKTPEEMEHEKTRKEQDKIKEKERKQKEKEEKERKRKDRKKKDSGKKDKSATSDKSDASPATTPRSPESIDLNKSFNSSYGIDSEGHEINSVDEEPISPRVIEKSPEEVPVSITPPVIMTTPPNNPAIYYDEDEDFEEAEIAYPVEVQIQTPKAASAEAPEPRTQEILVQHEDLRSHTMPRGKKEPEPQPYIQIPPKPSTSEMLAPLHSPDSGICTGIERDGRAPGHFVIVAIDFGTTFSGYAFSFTRDPDCSIHMMRKWEGGDPGVINQKTPTTLLLKPNGEFHSFGFAARDFYHDLDSKEALKWMYFEKFKMILHYDANLNKDTTMKAANGKAIPAMTVFCYALKFFKDHALQEITDQSDTKIMNEDVKWVLTVPAIWKAPAKQFMRQAAYIAGIASEEFPDQLLVALEPEAASIYVRRLRMHQLIPEKPERRPLSPRKEQDHHINPFNMDRVADEFRDGTRYMIVDCGGGTVDITVHEMDTKSAKLKELYKATGGPYGSVGVDLEFEELLVDIFGADFIDAFKCKYPVGWVDLMIAFESRKRATNPRKTNPLNVALPFTFIHFYKKFRHSQVETAIRNYKDSHIRWSTQGMLRLSPDAMRRLFTPTLEQITIAIGDVLNNPQVKDVRYMFLVGGFAESGVLQQEIRNEFGHIVQIRIPQDTSLAILKGAVLFGLDPTIVNVRRSRLTYGVGVLNRYVHGKHPRDKLVSKDGIDWCTDIFDKFVVTDQPVALGDTVLRSYTPAKPGQKSSVINIYCCENSDVKYITDKHVTKCGTLCLDLTDVQYHVTLPKRREIQARMVFGDTEIKMSALDVTTGKCVRANVDFLK